MVHFQIQALSMHFKPLFISIISFLKIDVFLDKKVRKVARL